MTDAKPDLFNEITNDELDELDNLTRDNRCDTCNKQVMHRICTDCFKWIRDEARREVMSDLSSEFDRMRVDICTRLIDFAEPLEDYEDEFLKSLGVELIKLSNGIANYIEAKKKELIEQ